MKSNGVSDKSGTAGGSFGIGKSAPFACSNLRTVFYRTLDRDGICAVQGISKLASFENNDKDGKLITTTGIGYYGNKDRNQSVPSVEELDELFIRNEKGTDIFILGFDASENWENEIVICLVEDFLLSFVHGCLEVKVGSQYINKENIENIVITNQDNLKNAYYYYQVLNTQNKTYPFTEEFNGMGILKLRVFLGDSLNRRVLISRSNGMKLKDMGNVSNNIQFSAVFEMEGEELISYFRKMENPQHDKWEADRVKDYGESPKEAQKIQRELQSWIRTKIQELGKYENGDQMDAQGIGDLIPDFFDFEKNSSGGKKEESISDSIKDWNVQVSDKPIILQNYSKENEIISQSTEKKTGILDDKGKYDSIDVPHKDHNDHDGASAGPAKASEGDGNRPFDQNTQVRTFKTRMFVSNSEKNEYTLSFYTSKDIVNGLLEIKISGEQSDYDANIKTAVEEASNLELMVSRNQIAITGVKKDIINRVKFQLLEDELFSLEVKLYEN